MGCSQVIPERLDTIDRRAAQGSHGGRPPAFDRDAYKQRNVAECRFNRLEQWRDLAARYAKRASIYQASPIIVAIKT